MLEENDIDFTTLLNELNKLKEEIKTLKSKPNVCNELANILELIKAQKENIIKQYGDKSLDKSNDFFYGITTYFNKFLNFNNSNYGSDILKYLFNLEDHFTDLHKLCQTDNKNYDNESKLFIKNKQNELTKLSINSTFCLANMPYCKFLLNKFFGIDNFNYKQDTKHEIKQQNYHNSIEYKLDNVIIQLNGQFPQAEIDNTIQFINNSFILCSQYGDCIKYIIKMNELIKERNFNKLSTQSNIPNIPFIIKRFDNDVPSELNNQKINDANKNYDALKSKLRECHREQKLNFEFRNKIELKLSFSLKTKIDKYGHIKT